MLFRLSHREVHVDARFEARLQQSDWLPPEAGKAQLGHPLNEAGGIERVVQIRGCVEAQSHDDDDGRLGGLSCEPPRPAPPPPLPLLPPLHTPPSL